VKGDGDHERQNPDGDVVEGDVHGSPERFDGKERLAREKFAGTIAMTRLADSLGRSDNLRIWDSQERANQIQR
jgi:hypothetical protein